MLLVTGLGLSLAAASSTGDAGLVWEAAAVDRVSLRVGAGEIYALVG